MVPFLLPSPSEGPVICRLSPKTLPNYKTPRNKALKGLEQFSEQTPFLSAVPFPCCGYFSMPSRGSALWLLITCLSEGYPLRHISLFFFLFLSIYAALFATHQQLDGMRSAGPNAKVVRNKFLPLAQRSNPPPFLPSSSIILHIH